MKRYYLALGFLFGALLLSPLVHALTMALLSLFQRWSALDFFLVDLLPAIFVSLFLLILILRSLVSIWRFIGFSVLVGVACSEFLILFLWPSVIDGSVLSIAVIYGPMFVYVLSLFVSGVKIWLDSRVK
jgi:hypothetical protein